VVDFFFRFLLTFSFLQKKKSSKWNQIKLVDFDIAYGGGFKISLEVELGGNIFIPIAITLSGFSGKV